MKRPAPVAALVAVLAAALATAMIAPSPVSAGEIPTLRQYLEWCQANDRACRADLDRYVDTAVLSTAGSGGSVVCALSSREHWADYMLNWLRTQGARADEPAPSVFHDAVKAIYRCII
jgi:hypothetical protein